MKMINGVKTSSIISSILYQSNFDVKFSLFHFLNNSARNEKQCAIQEDEVRGVCSRASSSSSLPLSSPPVETDDDSDGHLSVYKVPVMIIRTKFPCL